MSPGLADVAVMILSVLLLLLWPFVGDLAVDIVIVRLVCWCVVVLLCVTSSLVAAERWLLMCGGITAASRIKSR